MYFFEKILKIAMYIYTIDPVVGWTYSGEHGPTTWPGICKTGQSQSPINIKINTDTNTELVFGAPLKLIGGYWDRISWNSKWNGHAFVARMENATQRSTLLGGSLGSVYIFKSLQLHWGSEHTLNGKRFHGEMQLVHYNKKYSYKNALKEPDGLAVLGIFFEESNDRVHNGFSKFIEAMTSDVGNISKTIGKFKLAPFLRNSLELWGTYDGSLTAPPCTENVKWSVLLEPIFIKKDLISNIRKNNSDNFRPPQKLGQRCVSVRRKLNCSAGLNYSLKLIISLLLCTITML